MTADAIEQPIGTDPLARLRVSKRRHEVAERSIKARRVKQLDDLDQLMPHLPVEIDPDEKAKGVAHGTRWGRDEASYSVLLDLSAINIDGNNFDPLVEIAAAWKFPRRLGRIFSWYRPATRPTTRAARTCSASLKALRTTSTPCGIS
jgi:hypothetical protein